MERLTECFYLYLSLTLFQPKYFYENYFLTLVVKHVPIFFLIPVTPIGDFNNFLSIWYKETVSLHIVAAVPKLLTKTWN
jgi:hypothetical protein